MSIRQISSSRLRQRRQTATLLRNADACDDKDQRQDLLHEAVLLNLEVARSLAARYSGRGIPTDDLEQVAYAALVRAAADFDPAVSSEFLAYAVPTIRGEVKKHFRDCGWTIRPPRRVQEMQASVARSRACLQQSLGREPTLAEVADDIGADLDQVIEATAAGGCFTPTSLDRPVSPLSELTIGDLVAAPSTEFDAAEARVLLGPIIRRLPPRDRRILSLRFYEGRTQQEIGDELGVTQMQVSRLLTRILRDLRHALGQDSPDALGA